MTPTQLIQTAHTHTHTHTTHTHTHTYTHTHIHTLPKLSLEKFGKVSVHCAALPISGWGTKTNMLHTAECAYVCSSLSCSHEVRSLQSNHPNLGDNTLHTLLSLGWEDSRRFTRFACAPTMTLHNLSNREHLSSREHLSNRKHLSNTNFHRLSNTPVQLAGVWI